MNRILFVGINTVDNTWIVDSFPSREGRYRASEYTIQGGGMAANAAIAAGRLGGEVYYLGSIGDDTNGHLVKKWFEEDGVSTQWMHDDPDHVTSVAAILVEKSTGKRSIIPFDDKNSEYVPIPPDDFLDTVKVAVFDAHYMQASIEIARKLHRSNAITVADFMRYYPGMEEVLPNITHPIYPVLYAQEIAGSDQTEDMLAKLLEIAAGQFAAVTDGENGSWGKRVDGDIIHVPALEVSVVDTCGCGDSYHGAFAFGISLGWLEDQCMALGTIVAGLKATRSGSRTGLPGFKTALEVWRENKTKLGVKCPITS